MTLFFFFLKKNIFKLLVLSFNTGYLLSYVTKKGGISSTLEKLEATNVAAVFVVIVDG